MRPILIFLVDDDPIFLKVLETQFKERTNYEIQTFSTGEQCLKKLSEKPNIIFLDYNLNSSNPKAGNGIKILDKIKSADHNIPVVMLSSQENITIALNCMKHHAFDYIVKSPAAFIRAQKAISILFNQRKLEKMLKFYRKTTVTMSVSIGGAIISAIVTDFFFPYMFK